MELAVYQKMFLAIIILTLVFGTAWANALPPPDLIPNEAFPLKEAFARPAVSAERGNSPVANQDFTTSPSHDSQLTLPLIFNFYPSDPSIFGVEINPLYVTRAITYTQDTNLRWVRYRGLPWSEVEATPGVYDWNKISAAEYEMSQIGGRGLAPLIVVYSSPTWALSAQAKGRMCGAIAEEQLDNFADFMRAAVMRYSRPPFNIHHWELWNEPDVDPSLIGITSVFGCWGDMTDPYYGGDYYAEMLEHVYPAIKEADPSAQVILGGLLMDCDPTHPPTGRNCLASKFLEGILRNDGDHYLDAVAYHAYSHWNMVLQDWDLQHPVWSHRGGALLGKLDYVREVMEQYNAVKPVFLSETALLCYPTDPGCPGEEFYNAQANFVIRLFLRSWSQGLLGASWYTLDGPGWRDGGLLDANQTPQPAYEVLHFIAPLLQGAKYDTSLSADTLEGYQFHNFDRIYQVYWVNDASTVLLPMPPQTLAVYDKFGQDITPSGTTISVDFEPIVIEIQRPHD